MRESSEQSQSDLERLAATLIELRETVADNHFPMIKYLLEIAHLEVTETIYRLEEQEGESPHA